MVAATALHMAAHRMGGSKWWVPSWRKQFFDLLVAKALRRIPFARGEISHMCEAVGREIHRHLHPYARTYVLQSRVGSEVLGQQGFALQFRSCSRNPFASSACAYLSTYVRTYVRTACLRISCTGLILPVLRTHLCMYALGDPRLYVHSACSVAILRAAVSCLRSDSRLWYAAVLAGAGRPQCPRATGLALGGLGRQRPHGRELDRGPGWCPPPLLAVCGCLRLRAASPEATT